MFGVLKLSIGEYIERNDPENENKRVENESKIDENERKRVENERKKVENEIHPLFVQLYEYESNQEFSSLVDQPQL